MLETSARLLRLLSLLQTRRDWAGPDLAARLEVDVRTVRRDVDRLRQLGYPVHATPGVAGGYRLGAGAALPPLLLDDDEAVAVAVGLSTAAVGTVAGLAETSLRALAKLEQVLPKRLRPRVNALQTAVVPLAGTGPLVDAGVLTTIAGACRDHERLGFGYRSHTGEVSARSVEPHSVVCTARRWYLLAWDRDRADWRTFRVDRITPPLSTGLRFPPREPPQDAASFVSRGVSSGVYGLRARVLVHAPAEAVRARVDPVTAVVEPVDAARCLVLTGAHSLAALAYLVVSVGFEFEVQEPPELVTHLRELADRCHRATQAHDQPGHPTR